MSDVIERRGPFIVTGRREVYRNPWISVHEDNVIRPDDTVGLFGVVDIGSGRGGSSILPVDKFQNVYLIREFAYACNRETLEVVGGGIDPGETPLAAARRELKEELNLTADTCVQLGSISHMTTIVQATAHLFLALSVDAEHLMPEPGLSVERIALSAAVDMAFHADGMSSATCCLLLKAARYMGI